MYIFTGCNSNPVTSSETVKTFKIFAILPKVGNEYQLNLSIGSDMSYRFVQDSARPWVRRVVYYGSNPYQMENNWLNDFNDTVHTTSSYLHLYLNEDVIENKELTYLIKWHSNKYVNSLGLFGKQVTFDPMEPSFAQNNVKGLPTVNDVVNDGDLIKIWATVNYNNVTYADTVYLRVTIITK